MSNMEAKVAASTTDEVTVSSQKEESSISDQSVGTDVSAGGVNSQVDDFDDLAPKDYNLDEFLQNAPVVSGGEKKEAAETEAAEEQTDDANVSEAEVEEAKESKKIKISDGEFTEEELIAALEDSKNRKQWQKNLTQRSQIAANIPDDHVKLLIPYALKQKELPKDLDEVFNDPELPKTIEYEFDDDEEPIEIEVSKLSPKLLEVLGKKVFAKMYPELEEMRVKVEEKAKEIETVMQQVNAYQEQDATEKALQFMRRHPDYAITIRKGETLKENLANILNSGELHPELSKANKFLMLVQHIQQYGGTLEEAYAFYEGNKETSKKIKEQIKKNQESDISIEKGEKPPVRSKDDEFLDNFRDKSLQRLHDLGL